MPIFDVNWLAVIVTAIISMVIGALWYSVLFGKTWMNLMGFTKKDLEKAKEKGMGKSYIVMFLALLVMSLVTAYFINFAQAATFSAGMQVGFWLWLGFIATVMIGSVLWENKPFNLYLINIAHYLVILLVMGGILAIWS